MSVLLKRGSTGPEVLKLQTDLLAVGVLIEKPDGIFGPVTETAVRLFQQRAGLPQDGIVGPNTHAALAAAGAEEPHQPVATGTPWMDEALKFKGLKEIPGAEHNPDIVALWDQGRISWKATDDETPWCAVAVCAGYEPVGIRSTRSAWARSYETWGVATDVPAFGATVVFWRGDGPDDGGREWPRGHVGWLVAASLDLSSDSGLSRLSVYGGNQGNEMKVASYSADQLLGFRWPIGFPLPVEAAPGTVGELSETAWA